MTVFWRLILALLISDFIFQPERFFGKKIRRETAEFIHLSVFFALACLFNYQYLDLTWFSAGPLKLSGVPSLILLSVLHYALDALFEGADSGRMPQTVKVVWHKIMLFLAVLITSPAAAHGKTSFLFPEPWVIAACGLLLVTGYTTKVICSYEFDFCLIIKQSDDEMYFPRCSARSCTGFALCRAIRGFRCA